MLCQQNEGHPDGFHGCQSRNNTNGHHDRVILLWRQGGGLKRPGAVCCLQRGTRGQSRNYCGILMQVKGWFCPLTSVCLHAAISALLSPSFLPSLPLCYTDMTWSLNQSSIIYRIGKHMYQHLQNMKVGKALFEHLVTYFRLLQDLHKLHTSC